MTFTPSPSGLRSLGIRQMRGHASKSAVRFPGEKSSIRCHLLRTYRAHPGSSIVEAHEIFRALSTTPPSPKAIRIACSGALIGERSSLKYGSMLGDSEEASWSSMRYAAAPDRAMTCRRLSQRLLWAQATALSPVR